MMNDIVLEVDHLDLDLENGGSGKKLVQGLSFCIKKANTVALVGTSGAGKSMTALAVMRLLPHGIRQTGGSIVLGGRNLGVLEEEQMRRLRNTEMSMIMQNPMSAFDPVFTIRSHFFETFVSHGVKQSKKAMEETACKMLYEAGFSEPLAILKIYPFQMSGGMLQRVMIALALVANPQLLIADEATTDLDMISQAGIMRLLRQRTQERRMGVLLITHDLSVAAHFADEMVVVHQGEMIESGTVQNVMLQPQKPFTRQLVQAHLDLYQGRFSAFWH